MGIKRHECIDAKGIPLVWTFSKAADHDSRFGLKLLNEAKTKGILPFRTGLDRAYDDDQFRKDCLKIGTIPIVEYRSSVILRGYEELYQEEKKYCYQRWKVERNFSHKDNTNRRIDRFYEKSISAYSRLYKISVTRIYLKLLRSTLSKF